MRRRGVAEHVSSAVGYVSAAVLDGIALLLWTQRSGVESFLRPWAVPAHLPDTPKAQHPLVVEVWRVHSGRWDSRSGDQHSWAERSGRLGGLAIGTVVGSAVGAYRAMAEAMGSGTHDPRGDPLTWWSRSISTWFGGGYKQLWESSALGSQAMAGMFRRWSEAASALAGAYNEVMVTVPATIAGERNGPLYSFVAAMHTDSPVALWGDRTMQCGYRKRLAHFTGSTPGRGTVRSPERRPLLSVQVEPIRLPQTARSHEERNQLRRLTSLPLLGGLPDRRLAISIMERSWDAPSVRTAPIVASLSAEADFVENLADLSRPAVSRSMPPLWNGFQFEGVTARLTYPRHRAV